MTSLVTIFALAALWFGYAWCERRIERANQHETEMEMARTWSPTRKLSLRLAEDYLIERTPDELFKILFAMQGTIYGARLYAEACLDGSAPILPLVQATAPINSEETNAD